MIALKKESVHEILSGIESKLKENLQFYEGSKKEAISDSKLVSGSDKVLNAINRNGSVKCIGTFVGHTGLFVFPIHTFVRLFKEKKYFGLKVLFQVFYHVTITF